MKFPAATILALAALAGTVRAQDAPLPEMPAATPAQPAPEAAAPAEPAPETSAPASAIDPQAVALLHGALDPLAAARTFVVRFEFKASLNALEINQDTDTNYTLSVDRARKLAGLEKGNGMVGATVVMGPQRVFARVSNLNVHTDTDRPGTIAGLIEKKTWKDAMDLSFMSFGGRAFPDALLADDPAAYLLDGVTSAQKLDDAVFYGNQALHYRFTQKSGSWDLWFADDAKHALLGYKPDLEPAIAAAARAMAKDGKIKSDAAAESNARMSTEFLFSEITPGAPLDVDAFSFALPDDSKAVKSLTEGRAPAQGAPAAAQPVN